MPTESLSLDSLQPGATSNSLPPSDMTQEWSEVLGFYHLSLKKAFIQLTLWPQIIL